MDRRLTSSPQCIVIKSRFADWKSAPLIPINLGIRVDDIKILVLLSYYEFTRCVLSG